MAITTTLEIYVDIIDMKRKNNVSIISLLPHSTHKLQLLDIGFLAPLKFYYDQEIVTHLRNNLGRVVTNNKVDEYYRHTIRWKAYYRTATMLTSISAF